MGREGTSRERQRKEGGGGVIPNTSTCAHCSPITARWDAIITPCGCQTCPALSFLIVSMPGALFSLFSSKRPVQMDGQVYRAHA